MQILLLPLFLLDKYYPEKQIKITPKDPDFITPEIKCKLRIKNKLMLKRRTEEAGRMAEQIGKDIARRNSISLRHINQRNGTKELWDAVRKLTKRKQEDQIPSGLNATTLNKHYASISTDRLYTAPTKKSSVTSNEAHFTEYEIFKYLDSLRVTATGLDHGT